MDQIFPIVPASSRGPSWMQFASFHLADPAFECFGPRTSFQLVALENLYGVDAPRTCVEASGDAWTRRADDAGVIPTLAFQDGTLEHCRSELEARLAALA
jgi:hypothetical protein